MFIFTIEEAGISSRASRNGRGNKNVHSILVGFVVLLILGLPVAIGLGGAALLYFIPDGFFTQMVQTTFAGMASFSLLAIPLFMLAGNLMSESGITEELANFARLLLGHIRGGLGLATIFASAIFAAITGSAVATAVAIGGVLIPTKVKAGYDEDVAAALTATLLSWPHHPSQHSLYHLRRHRQRVHRGAFPCGIVPGALSRSRS